MFIKKNILRAAGASDGKLTTPEIPPLLVRLDHVASIIVNADRGVM